MTLGARRVFLHKWMQQTLQEFELCMLISLSVLITSMLYTPPKTDINNKIKIKKSLSKI